MFNVFDGDGVWFTGVVTSNVRAVLDRGFTQVSISDGGKATAVDGLRGIMPWASHVKSLAVGSESALDPELVPQFPNLTSLSLELDAGKVVIDLAQHPHLQTLNVAARRSVDVSGTAPLLAEVGVRRATARTIATIEELPALTSLALVSPARWPCQFASGQVTHLAMTVHKRLPVPDRISGVANLETLELAAIPGLQDLKAFTEVRALRRLVAWNCRDLASLDGPGYHSDAKLERDGSTPTEPFGESGPPKEIRIDEYEGEWYLDFYCGLHPADEAAYATGTNPTGYFWNKVVKRAFPELARRLEFDSESGMFCAIGEPADLEELKTGLEPLLEDPTTVRRLME